MDLGIFNAVMGGFRLLMAKLSPSVKCMWSDWNESIGII